MSASRHQLTTSRQHDVTACTSASSDLAHPLMRPPSPPRITPSTPALYRVVEAVRWGLESAEYHTAPHGQLRRFGAWLAVMAVLGPSVILLATVMATLLLPLVAAVAAILELAVQAAVALVVLIVIMAVLSGLGSASRDHHRRRR